MKGLNEFNSILGTCQSVYYNSGETMKPFDPEQWKSLRGKIVEIKFLASYAEKESEYVELLARTIDLISFLTSKRTSIKEGFANKGSLYKSSQRIESQAFNVMPASSYAGHLNGNIVMESIGPRLGSFIRGLILRLDNLEDGKLTQLLERAVKGL